MTGSKAKNPHPDGSTSRTEPSLEEKALIRQWQEYKKVYLDKMGSNIPNAVLSEMDYYLKDRSYLAGHHLTAADVQIYLALHEYFSKQTFQVKEKYINLARWFNHVQHLQHQRPLLTFSRTLLYN